MPNTPYAPLPLPRCLPATGTDNTTPLQPAVYAPGSAHDAPARLRRALPATVLHRYIRYDACCCTAVRSTVPTVPAHRTPATVHTITCALHTIYCHIPCLRGSVACLRGSHACTPRTTACRDTHVHCYAAPPRLYTPRLRTQFYHATLYTPATLPLSAPQTPACHPLQHTRTCAHTATCLGLDTLPALPHWFCHFTTTVCHTRCTWTFCHVHAWVLAAFLRATLRCRTYRTRRSRANTAPHAVPATLPRFAVLTRRSSALAAARAILRGRLRAPRTQDVPCCCWFTLRSAGSPRCRAKLYTAVRRTRLFAAPLHGSPCAIFTCNMPTFWTAHTATRAARIRAATTHTLYRAHIPGYATAHLPARSAVTFARACRVLPWHTIAYTALPACGFCASRTGCTAAHAIRLHAPLYYRARHALLLPLPPTRTTLRVRPCRTLPRPGLTHAPHTVHGTHSTTLHCRIPAPDTRTHDTLCRVWFTCIPPAARYLLPMHSFTPPPHLVLPCCYHRLFIYYLTATFHCAHICRRLWTHAAVPFTVRVTLYTAWVRHCLLPHVCATTPHLLVYMSVHTHHTIFVPYTIAPHTPHATHHTYYILLPPPTAWTPYTHSYHSHSLTIPFCHTLPSYPSHATSHITHTTALHTHLP